MIIHIPDCAKGNAKPCPAPNIMHGEAVGQHWWSGWPGAYCMKCGASDPNEICLAGCHCHCHEHDFEELDKYVIL